MRTEMINRVLVPLDGSPSSETAIPWAIATVGESGSLHIFHSHVTPAPLLVEGVVISDPTLDMALKEEEDRYLENLAAQIRQHYPKLKLTYSNLDSDETPVESLVSAIMETGSELVVMTTHGRGPLARFWLGSVTDDMIGRSPVPIMILRRSEDKPIDLTQLPTLRQVIIPVNDATQMQPFLPFTGRIAEHFQAHLTLLHVSESGTRTVSRVENDGVSDSQKSTGVATPLETMNFDALARTLSSRATVSKIDIVASDTTAQAILDFAGTHTETMIAIATHARKGISRLFHGSVADEVIRGAVGPVLVFHSVSTE